MMPLFTLFTSSPPPGRPGVLPARDDARKCRADVPHLPPARQVVEEVATDDLLLDRALDVDQRRFASNTDRFCNGRRHQFNIHDCGLPHKHLNHPIGRAETRQLGGDPIVANSDRQTEATALVG